MRLRDYLTFLFGLLLTLLAWWLADPFSRPPSTRVIPKVSISHEALQELTFSIPTGLSKEQKEIICTYFFVRAPSLDHAKYALEILSNRSKHSDLWTKFMILMHSEQNLAQAPSLGIIYKASAQFVNTSAYPELINHLNELEAKTHPPTHATVQFSADILPLWKDTF